ncbi:MULTISPECIES: glycosyltransferase family A protein [Capnocytophaga]|uniref:Putative beta-glycosyltransferase n=1 Tax=Capnocytophaga canis TaxID=1848903 RepID=A0A0B7IUQ2_9FLAO|nr:MULTISPECIES: glycosyltransferase family 2 protein [Capnocytophaga]ATA74777.1 glycosyltransferase family 2 protein [Capnocytophaga sp. H2931]CEN53797.1 putative beta-glycosyltransferase [Capnocytophaga canis]
MKKITVFTPTYNRAHLLPRLYQSLCEQTSRDFIWLVIDDGSHDNTQELIRQWQKDNIIEITYLFKENGGMHTGHNLAYKNISTELNVCIDSDDYMPRDAIQKILITWLQIENKEKIAGIIGLDADNKGKIIGTDIPVELKKGSLWDLYNKYGVKGDKKLVIRTDVIKQYPLYPEYEHERLVPLDVLYIMIGRDYDFMYQNEVYCIVEYQEEGSSKTIFKQYKQSPRGFAYARNIYKKYEKSFISNLKSSVHLVSSAIFAKDIKLILKGEKIYQNWIVLPLGFILNMYIRCKIRF